MKPTKRSHWDYLEPTQVLGFLLMTFVWGFFFAVIGALVGAVTGIWWIPFAVVLASPFVALWLLVLDLKARQAIFEGDV